LNGLCASSSAKAIRGIRYWQKVVYQRVRYRKGKEDKSKYFSVQLQFAGRRAEFNLRTANTAVAAGKARDIYEHRKLTGWGGDSCQIQAWPGTKK
jgi:hypothetical protein